MKRLLTGVILLCLLLNGCGKNLPEQPLVPPETTGTSANSSDVTPEPEIPVPVYRQQPLIGINMPAVTEYTKDEDGNILFSHVFQDLIMTFSEIEIVDKIIIDYQSRLWEHEKQAQLIQAQAEQDLPTEIPYTYQTLYSPVRLDSNALSLYGTVVSYSGGAHSTRTCTAANYSMLTGDVLTLGSILVNIDALESLYQQLVEELQKNEDTLHLLGDYSQIVRENLFAGESYYEDWFFTQTGLSFFFPPYEIAPYATGIVVVEIPYEKLVGIISDDFFPPEAEPTQGVISAVRVQDANMDGFTQMAPAVVDHGAEEFLLYTETTVYDIRLEYGQWNEQGTIFTPSYTVAALRSLTPGDAIIVQAYFNDVLPILRLTYTSGTEQERFYIMQSGEDGSVYLTSQ